jgi:hypothetical protein
MNPTQAGHAVSPGFLLKLLQQKLARWFRNLRLDPASFEVAFD